jgi:two-component system, cell cycle sensor histidine kinase and response regulator CckA
LRDSAAVPYVCRVTLQPDAAEADRLAADARARSEGAHARNEGAHARNEGAHARNEGAHARSEGAHAPSEDAHARSAIDAEDLRNAILQSALDGIVGMDHEGHVIEFNAAAERMFGRTRADVIGQDMADLLIPPALRERHREGLRQYLRTGRSVILDKRLEMTALRADGSEFPVELTVTRAGKGEPPRFNAFLRDITEQKAAERELKLHIERFQIVERATNDAVWDWDIPSGTVWRSETFGRLFGHDIPGGQSRHYEWMALVHPEDLQATERHLQHVLASGGQFWDAEYRFRRRDGSYARVLDRGYVMRDDSGRAVRMIGAMIDISRLKEAEERLEQLATHINEVFWLTDASKQEMLYISPAYERIWGRTIVSLREVAMSWMDAVHPEDRETVERALGRQAQGEYDEEYRIIRADGSIRWIRDRAFPIRDESGRVYRIAGVAADITEWKQAEEQLRQSQKLEAIGKLSGGVAHDFNNILTVIQGNASLLLDVVAEPDRELVTEIADASERGASLTKQLLLFSRQQPMRLTRVNLSEVAADMLKLLGRLVGARIALRSSLEEKLPSIHADESMVQQVILNLVVNARDAMPNDGTIRLSTTARVFSEADAARHPDARPGPAVCLTVEDTGSGIAPETLPRIFEPFFTTKEAGKGTGLGLATVYGIVRQHRGWIDVRSRVGEGTVFDVCFPATEG